VRHPPNRLSSSTNNQGPGLLACQRGYPICKRATKADCTATEADLLGSTPKAVGQLLRQKDCPPTIRTNCGTPALHICITMERLCKPLPQCSDTAGSRQLRYILAFPQAECWTSTEMPIRTQNQKLDDGIKGKAACAVQ
jgi:hypothetical protein